MRKIIQLPSIPTVTPGAEATLTIPVKPTYEKIMFEYGGTSFDLADMKNIELRINGNPVQSFADGAQLDQMNKFWGREESAGVLTLWFMRPELTNISQRRMFSLGTANVQTASIHMDIAPGAVAPTLKAHAVISEPKPLKFVTAIKRFPHNSSVSGQVDIDNIVRHPTLRPMAMHLFKADISDVEVEMDNIKIYDASKALAESIQKQNGRTPQSSAATHIDWLGDNDIGNAIINGGASDFRLKTTLDTSGSTEIVVEYLQGIG